MNQFIFLLFSLVLSGAAYSQTTDLTKLSQEEREKHLFEIATEAMKKYAPSYYREDLKPVIGYAGTYTTDKQDKNYGRNSYRIDFLFDIEKDKREGDDNMYGGSVGIFEDTGKVNYLRPTGWWTLFYIDDEIETRNGTHKVAPPMKVPENPYKNLK
ncbi:MAG: hypothetical protein LBR65_07055 [Culturomica sp.]|jgi:hypothetical protein|nr:hypothetical protein [Culturomica sp.]